MRLFIACETGAAVGDAAAALIEELRGRVARLAPQARLTWVPRERLHFTVRFIGSVDDTRASALQEALIAPLPVPAFDAVVHGVGAFPDRRPPRVIWAGLRSGTAEMVALARAVNQRIDRLVGGAPEALRPHLTLARVKEAHGLRPAALFAGLESVELGVTRVDAVTLFESRQVGRSLEYVPLNRTPLAS